MKRVVIIDYSHTTKIAVKTENVILLNCAGGGDLEAYIKIAKRMQADEIIIV